MLEARTISKVFENPRTQVLYDVSFKIGKGEFVAITGKSGSGKSTLLYIISSLDGATSGEVIVDDKSIGKMTPDEIHAFRNQQMGFVFQFHFLLPELSALENVLMPTRKIGKQNELKAFGLELLSRFGLADKQGRLPRELSGGEQQRVAIARALIMRPRFLFADEPTGNLDSANGQKVMQIMEEIVKDGETSVIFVTHDRDFAERASRQIEIADGRVVMDQARSVVFN